MYHQDIFRLSLMVLSSALCLNKQSANVHADAIASDAASQASTWNPSEDSWNYWWSYSGVSGPAYWGLLNLDWFLCDRGRRQSPINIETQSLVYDPHLTPLRADNNLISGLLYNDGHALIFNNSALRQWSRKDNTRPNVIQTNDGVQFNNSVSRRKRSKSNDDNLLPVPISYTPPPEQSHAELPDSSAFLRQLSTSVGLSISETDKLEPSAEKSSSFENSLLDSAESSEPVDNNNGAEAEQNQVSEIDQVQVQFTGAGLAYPYKFEALHLRFGSDSAGGSEHRINSVAYAAELQVISYNSLLYRGYSEASTRPNGLLAVSILIETLPPDNRSAETNEQLNNLLKGIVQVKHRGFSTPVSEFNLSALLPTVDQYVTYEGSLTTPGCHESVTWILLNKPLYITQSNLEALRTLSADEQSIAPTGTLIAGNIRPVQPVNSRPIRTNIKPSDRAGTLVDNSAQGTNTSSRDDSE